jgi:hypothetical protein
MTAPPFASAQETPVTPQSRSEFGNEITPLAITGDIVALCDDLRTDTPLHLDVAPTTEAKFGWCSANVLRQCRTASGSPLYGWLIWEASGLYLNAEFHCVWHDGLRPRDITPTQEGETRVLFAPDPLYGQDFDFRRRPNNRRFRSYRWAEQEPLVQAKLAETSAPALEYKRRQAEKKGGTVRQAILSTLVRDPLETLIDDFLTFSGETDAMLTVTERGIECLPPYSIERYHRRVLEADKIRRKMLKMAAPAPYPTGLSSF